MKRMTLVLALAFPIFTASTAYAQLNWDSFVASTGSDANLCIRSAPCATYTRAFAHSEPGGIIHAVDAGAYGPLTITQGFATTYLTGRTGTLIARFSF